jgi:hypothetical protein
MTYDRLFLAAAFVATVGECTGLGMRSTVRGRSDTCPRSKGGMHDELGSRLRCRRPGFSGGTRPRECSPGGCLRGRRLRLMPNVVKPPSPQREVEGAGLFPSGKITWVITVVEYYAVSPQWDGLVPVVGRFDESVEEAVRDAIV